MYTLARCGMCPDGTLARGEMCPDGTLARGGNVPRRHFRMCPEGTLALTSGQGGEVWWMVVGKSTSGGPEVQVHLKKVSACATGADSSCCDSVIRYHPRTRTECAHWQQTTCHGEQLVMANNTSWRHIGKQLDMANNSTWRTTRHGDKNVVSSACVGCVRRRGSAK